MRLRHANNCTRCTPITFFSPPSLNYTSIWQLNISIISNTQIASFHANSNSNRRKWKTIDSLIFIFHIYTTFHLRVGYIEWNVIAILLSPDRNLKKKLIKRKHKQAMRSSESETSVPTQDYRTCKLTIIKSLCREFNVKSEKIERLRMKFFFRFYTGDLCKSVKGRKRVWSYDIWTQLAMVFVQSRDNSPCNATASDSDLWVKLFSLPDEEEKMWKIMKKVFSSRWVYVWFFHCIFAYFLTIVSSWK